VGCRGEGHSCAELWRRRGGAGRGGGRGGRTALAAKVVDPGEAKLQEESKRLRLAVPFLRAVRQKRGRAKALQMQIDSLNLPEEEVLAKATEIQKLADAVVPFEKLLKAVEALAESAELARGTDELAELAREEVSELEEQLEVLRETVQLAMLPSDPQDDAGTIIMELRPGVGGDEAALWVADLLLIYENYAEQEGMEWKVLDISGHEAGGVKEASVSISGEQAYSKLKWESGVHRVQRVPATETQGRTHTSTAVLAVMPVLEETVITINIKDVEIKTCRAGGPGGQNVNKLETAVHAVHLPTGLAVFSRVERTQGANKRNALLWLQAKLDKIEADKRLKERSDIYSSQVGTGDRSEKVRTYNYKDARVTDHRLRQNFPIANILGGRLQEVSRLLRIQEQGDKLKAFEEEMKETR